VIPKRAGDSRAWNELLKAFMPEIPAAGPGGAMSGDPSGTFILHIEPAGFRAAPERAAFQLERGPVGPLAGFQVLPAGGL